MKKIIALCWLAMVMALALCTTAFAADNYDLVSRPIAPTSVVRSSLRMALMAEKTNKSITITAAASYSDGTGNLSI